MHTKMHGANNKTKSFLFSMFWYFIDALDSGDETGDSSIDKNNPPSGGR